MEELGLTRIPYYSELSVFTRKDVSNDPLTLVLSVMLYWHSLDRCQRFNSRNHVHLLSRNLKISPEAVKDCLNYLTNIGILECTQETVTTNSENPDKQIKQNEFYTLNFHVLHELLKEHNLNIPVKILRMASDDYFDIYSYLSPKRMPVVQGLNGMVKGGIYNEAALNVCRIICGICEDPLYEEFSYKALAPGWRMLSQPPAKPEDLVERYLRDGERSVDIDLTDGSFFLPDGDYFGTEKHRIWHSGKANEPRVLAAALYLCFTALSNDVEFFSDLRISQLKDAFALLYRFTGLTGRLSDTFFVYQDLTDEKKDDAIKEYEQILNILK
ncbi:MAG: hypothetical protein ACI4UM_05955 [Succinivibrio sp.]